MKENDSLIQKRFDTNNLNKTNFEASQLTEFDQSLIKFGQILKESISLIIYVEFAKTNQLFADKFYQNLIAHTEGRQWMISRIKYKCLITLESILEGSLDPHIEERLCQAIPYRILEQNLYWIFDNFKFECDGNYSHGLFHNVLK